MVSRPRTRVSQTAYRPSEGSPEADQQPPGRTSRSRSPYRDLRRHTRKAHRGGQPSHNIGSGQRHLTTSASSSQVSRQASGTHASENALQSDLHRRSFPEGATNTNSLDRRSREIERAQRRDAYGDTAAEYTVSHRDEWRPQPSGTAPGVAAGHPKEYSLWTSLQEGIKSSFPDMEMAAADSASIGEREAACDDIDDVMSTQPDRDSRQSEHRFGRRSRMSSPQMSPRRQNRSLSRSSYGHVAEHEAQNSAARFHSHSLEKESVDPGVTTEGFRGSDSAPDESCRTRGDSSPNLSKALASSLATASSHAATQLSTSSSTLSSDVVEQQDDAAPALPRPKKRRKLRFVGDVLAESPKLASASDNDANGTQKPTHSTQSPVSPEMSSSSVSTHTASPPSRIKLPKPRLRQLVRMANTSFPKSSVQSNPMSPPRPSTEQAVPAGSATNMSQPLSDAIREVHAPASSTPSGVASTFAGRAPGGIACAYKTMSAREHRIRDGAAPGVNPGAASGVNPHENSAGSTSGAGSSALQQRPSFGGTYTFGSRSSMFRYDTRIDQYGRVNLQTSSQASQPVSVFREKFHHVLYLLPARRYSKFSGLYAHLQNL